MRLSITGIAAGGDGVGRLDNGMTVFVPRAAPGDVIEMDLVERRPRFGRGRLLDIAVPGPERVEPACPHYVRDACGGCQLQHLSVPAQLAAKRRIVGDALRRIGRQAVDDPPIVESSLVWRYRTRVTLAAAHDRIGYHAFDRPDRVLDLDDCHIARECVMTIWHAVRLHRRLLPAALESVAVRQDRDGGVHVVVSDAGTGVWDAGPLAHVVARPDLSIWWRPAGGAARVVAGPQTGFPVLAFEQVHPAFGDRIRQDAVAALGDVADGVVWDLYGGTGDAARMLAEAGAEVWTVDADRAAQDWGQRQVGDPSAAGRIHWVAGLVEESLHRLPHPDAVVVNPPRGGLAKGVCAAVAQRRTTARHGRVSYVSCDPATLARDLTRLPSLHVRSVTAYDLFPQTSHVETLAVLEAA